MTNSFTAPEDEEKKEELPETDKFIKEKETATT